MKKLFSLVLIITSISLFAQKDVTQFLGIPIDGSKSEVIQKLKNKGFIISPDDKGLLTGEFNGRDVYIGIATNNNKVYRIMVSDKNVISESDIKIRFNKLCQQFENNKKYIAASLTSNYTLSDNEDISYQMTVNKKRYEASYYQLTDSDNTDFYGRLVWFIISELYGKYYITMFYDNEYNKADGEDL